MTTIVMVHGAFCGGWTFERFRAPFEAVGLEVIAPDLRGHGPEERAEAVIGVSMADYAADIAHLCAGLPEPPVLLGHSMGGLVAQLAARKARVQALVLLAPSPPWGVAASSLEEAFSTSEVPSDSFFANFSVQPPNATGWAWQSISPGSRVRSPRSITSASGAGGAPRAGPA